MKSILTARNISRNEVLFLSGSFVTNLGKGVQIIASAFLVLQVTQSVSAVGVLFLALAIPEALVSLFFGKLADSWSRKKVACWTDVARGLLTLLLPVAVFCGFKSGLVIFGLNFLVALGDAVAAPTSNALAAESVQSGHERKLSARYEISTQCGNVISVALGGFVIDRFGAASVLFLSSCAYFCSALLYSFLKLPVHLHLPHSKNEIAENRSISTPPSPFYQTLSVRKSKTGELKNKALSVVRNPVAGAALLFCLTKLLITCSNALLVPLFVNHFGTNMNTVGIADAFAAIGMTVAGFSVAFFLARVSENKMMIGGFLVTGLLLALTPHLGATGAVVLTGVQALALGYGRITMRSKLFQGLPVHSVGRVFGFLNGLGLLAAAGGSVLFTSIAERSGFRLAYLCFGMVVVAWVASAWLVIKVRATSIPEKTRKSRQRYPPQ